MLISCIIHINYTCINCDENNSLHCIGSYILKLIILHNFLKTYIFTHKDEKNDENFLQNNPICNRTTASNKTFFHYKWPKFSYISYTNILPNSVCISCTHRLKRYTKQDANNTQN